MSRHSLSVSIPSSRRAVVSLCAIVLLATLLLTGCGVTSINYDVGGGPPPGGSQPGGAVIHRRRRRQAELTAARWRSCAQALWTPPPNRRRLCSR